MNRIGESETPTIRSELGSSAGIASNFGCSCQTTRRPPNRAPAHFPCETKDSRGQDECFLSAQGLTLLLSLGSSALAQPADAAYGLAGDGPKADLKGLQRTLCIIGRGGLSWRRACGKPESKAEDGEPKKDRRLIQCISVCWGRQPGCYLLLELVFRSYQKNCF
jgi:hypothetical protein